MAEGSKVFWACAGAGVLILAGAVAYRIVTGTGHTSVDIEGVKVSVDFAQKGIESAQAALTSISRQAEAERNQIKILTRQLDAAV